MYTYGAILHTNKTFAILLMQINPTTPAGLSRQARKTYNGFLQALIPRAHVGKVNAMVPAPAGDVFWSGGDDGWIREWEAWFCCLLGRNHKALFVMNSECSWEARVCRSRESFPAFACEMHSRALLVSCCVATLRHSNVKQAYATIAGREWQGSALSLCSICRASVRTQLYARRCAGLSNDTGIS